MKTIKTTLIVSSISLILFIFCSGAYAMNMNKLPLIPETKYSMEHCLAMAIDRRPGRVITLELQDEVNRGLIYEFRIVGADGITWIIEVDAHLGTVNEEERLATGANDPLFKRKAKISESEAKKTALMYHPGRVVETIYTIEDNGDVHYEFDIVVSDSLELIVVIDATDGEIHRVDRQLYTIGAGR